MKLFSEEDTALKPFSEGEENYTKTISLKKRTALKPFPEEENCTETIP